LLYLLGTYNFQKSLSNLILGIELEEYRILNINQSEGTPMKIRQRNYSGEADQYEMIQLARETQAENMHVMDLPYRFSSWALDAPDDVGLWVNDDNQLVAWAVMQTPFWSIDYVFRSNTGSDLHSQILSWADRRAHALINTPYGLSAWFVNVFADQLDRMQELERNEYVSQAELGENAWSKVWMECSGKMEVPSYPPPAGFTIRSLGGESEVEAYVKLHRAVFETKNMTFDWRLRTLRHPDYRPELDVVVVAPDGRLAAFCIGWICSTPDGECRGQIEPLGCHADFRSYALGRVALCEALRRLQQYGAERIFVETDNYRNTAFRLYESIGFRVIRDVMVYGKDYNGSQG
jgi:ribosomal protein S18 acetylase RimI-like enzyme